MRVMRMVGAETLVVTNAVGSINPQYQVLTILQVGPQYQVLTNTVPGIVNPYIIFVIFVVCSLKGRQQEICKRLIVAMIIQVGDIMLVCDHINMFGLAGNSPLR